MNKNVPLIVAAVLGLLAVGLIYAYLNRMKQEVYKGMDMVHVLVASQDIAAGAALSQDNVAGRSYPQKYVGDRAILVSDATVVMNARLKNNIQKGQPVFWSDIEGPEAVSAGLAAVIEKGMRALTIPVTEITGVAGMLKPNHRVDILFTFDSGLFEPLQDTQSGAAAMPETMDDLRKAFLSQVKSQFQSAGKLNTALLMENILILATGKAFPEGGILPQAGPDQGDVYNSVTLLVSPAQARIIAYVMDQGKLTLLMRNPQDADLAPQRELVTPEVFYDFLSQTNISKALTVEVQ